MISKKVDHVRNFNFSKGMQIPRNQGGGSRSQLRYNTILATGKIKDMREAMTQRIYVNPWIFPNQIRSPLTKFNWMQGRNKGSKHDSFTQGLLVVGTVVKSLIFTTYTILATQIALA